jgi:hypothetical protein
MSDIEVNGNVYRIGRMDARKQFHVSRRLAPLLAGLGGAISGKKADAAATFQPIAEALAQMSDEDTDYILDNCLAVVSRQQGNQFAPVMARGGSMMFEDIDLPTMMQLTIAVIRENLGGFFPASA